MKREKLIRAAFCLLLVAWLPACASRLADSNDPMTRMRGRARAESAVMKAQIAWQQLRSPASRTAEDRALNQYRTATAELITALSATAPTEHWRGEHVVQRSDGSVRFRFDTGDGKVNRSPARYERFTPITKPLRNPIVPHATRDGLGAPVLAKVRRPMNRGVAAPGYPERGQYTPLTAWLEFSATPRGETTAVLHLADPREQGTVKVGSRMYPLAQDLATPVHARLGHQNFVRAALRGLFRPELFFKQRGVYLSGAYRPDKVPIILTHGLFSDPAIWENLTLAILADPQLGTRCQIWYYFYPTGVGVPTSALYFREKLATVRRFYDPEGDDFASRNLILVGHSMGGILSRMMCVDSGEDFRRAYFLKPLADVRINASLRDQAKHTLYFSATPGVRSAIFIATPHAGSELAEDKLGRFGDWLIRLPKMTITSVMQIASMNVDVLNPELRRFRNFGLTSIDTLSPKHPYFKALAARPLRVPFYSIIGDRGRGDSPNSSDGVVPYSSSNVPGARSVKIVPYGHSCVEQPETVAEVLRILRQAVR